MYGGVGVASGSVVQPERAEFVVGVRGIGRVWGRQRVLWRHALGQDRLGQRQALAGREAAGGQMRRFPGHGHGRALHQEKHYPARVQGSELANPDFCALAQAYGYAAERVTHTADFEAALLRALANPRGTVIEIPLDPEVITTRGTLSAITQAAQRSAA